MSLSDRLQELRSARTLVIRRRLPQISEIEKALQRLNAKYDQIGPTTLVDYEDLIARVRSAARTGGLSNLTPREVRLTASCLFEGKPPLAADIAFLDQLLSRVRQMNSRITVKRLIHTYCLHFDENDPAIGRIGNFLQEILGSNVGRTSSEWAARSSEFGIFDARLAPARLTRLVMGSPHPRAELERLGLKGQLLVGGLSAAVFLRALDALRQRLHTEPKLEEVDRILNWAHAGTGSLSYSAHRGALANALLLPWSGREPDQEIRQRIQTFLLDNLSDPRINIGAWITVDPVARDVMIRWLAQATLEQFLKVVDKTAERQQWNYRRAFWTAYIERRLVTNAWVAFGTSGAHVARRIAESSSDSLMRRFATLGGASPDQAVLLLHIGNLIIADWSHNGRLRIWRQSNQNAPEFNLPSYAASNLRAGSDFDTVHLPPDGWQEKAEAFIRKHTKIRLERTDYMPRRNSRS